MESTTESPDSVQFDAALLQATGRAKTAYPAEHVAIERGLQIALGGGVTLRADGMAIVQSQSHPGDTYRINGRCTCRAAAEAPEGRCKHRWAKSLTIWARQRSPEPEAADECPREDIDETPEALAQAPGIAPEHLVEIQGKKFVKFAGLLALAHTKGLASLSAEWTYNDTTLSLAQAVAVFPWGRFEECGDATPENVSKKVVPHFRRVALTRAKARALRDALNIDMVALEELGE